jgi:hypothetical protein
MKHFIITLISVSLVLLSFNMRTLTRWSSAASSEVIMQDEPTGCEYNSAALDVLAQKSRLADLIIVIARLGSNETRPNLNSRRLHNVRTYLTEFLTDPSVRRSSETIVLAQGERVLGFGRVEFYVNGKLVSTLTLRTNADLTAANCGIEPPESPCPSSMKNFYPCKDKHAHRPRTRP